MNTAIESENNELFQRLEGVFKDRVVRSRFPLDKISEQISEPGKEFLCAKYRYHEDGAIHCEVRIWNEAGKILFYCETSSKKEVKTIIVTEADISDCVRDMREFFSEFLTKYKNN